MLCKKPYTRKESVGSKVTELGPTYGCGQCLHCRINRARVWTHRLLLEGRMHESSIFVTLTYNDEHLPGDLSVDPQEMQKFMKRLRRKVEPARIRFFGVGEYGDRSMRPHYHLIIFGLSERAKELVEKAWEKGFVYIGDLSKDSAAYITGYCTKSLLKADDARLEGRKPEFMRCSNRNPEGIGPGGIGVGYMKVVAEAMCSYPHLEQPIIRELRHGKLKKPLGRYLTKQLAVEMNKVWELEEEKANFIHEEYIANLEIEKRERERKCKMNSQKVKHDIFKKRRLL